MRSENTSSKGSLWDLLVVIRLYVIIFLFIAPIVHLIFQLGYFPPIDIVIFGLALLLILKFVLFESRTSSKRFLKASLAFLLPVTCILIFNFVIGLIFAIIYTNPISIITTSIILAISFLYFTLALHFKPFKTINSWLVSKEQSWAEGHSFFLRRQPLSLALICWLIISAILIFVPYPIYHQNAPTSSGGRTIGLWVGANFFDTNYTDHLPDDTLELLANSSVYVVITVKGKDIGPELAERLNRCKTFGIKVHLSMSVYNQSYKFVNIWTFEQLMAEIDEILSFLNNSNLLGDPVTTVVYDMECLPEAFYLIYIDSNIREKLTEYYTIQETFVAFNQHIQEDYNLNVQICTDYFQSFDEKDGDDDLIANRGLMQDESATRSYMVYRRDNLGQNHILDHCRFLEDGETIILNSWKFEGYLCWNDIECAIEDARLVLGYPGKTLHLEVWTLYYFLQSYGLEGLHSFINALNGDWTSWPTIKVENSWPYSTTWDLVLYGVSLFDLYGPLFRLINNAF